MTPPPLTTITRCLQYQHALRLFKSGGRNSALALLTIIGFPVAEAHRELDYWQRCIAGQREPIHPFTPANTEQV